MAEDSQRLLLKGDPLPVAIDNPGGSSRYLLIGDHAGNAIPAALGRLGVRDDDLGRHIGWDIGTRRLGRSMAERLDAVFVAQVYSRLVIDCNRDTQAADAMPVTSDGTAIPGNAGLSQAERLRRIAEIHAPYQAAIAAALTPAHALVSLHSFTPRMGGLDRPWHIGILHDEHDDRLALHLMVWLAENSALTIGDNEPYRMDATDHTVPRHAFASERLYAEIEVRQDLLADPAESAVIADLLCAGLAAFAW